MAAGAPPGPHSTYCLSLYLKHRWLLGSWKVVEVFVTKRVGTLVVDDVQ